MTINSKLQSNLDKVLNKIGLSLTSEDCKRLSSSAPGAIEAVLI